MQKRVDKQVMIHDREDCPIRILDCGLLYDEASGGYALQMNLQNDSGRTLAEVTLHVLAYDLQGRELGCQEQTYRIVKTPDGFTVRADRNLRFAAQELGRISVRVWRALVYKSGGGGETESVLLRNGR